jgi:hypothetical protein
VAAGSGTLTKRAAAASTLPENSVMVFMGIYRSYITARVQRPVFHLVRRRGPAFVSLVSLMSHRTRTGERDQALPLRSSAPAAVQPCP